MHGLWKMKSFMFVCASYISFRGRGVWNSAYVGVLLDISAVARPIMCSRARVGDIKLEMGIAVLFLQVFFCQMGISFVSQDTCI